MTQSCFQVKTNILHHENSENEQELQQIATNLLFDIDFDEYIRLYRDFTANS